MERRLKDVEALPEAQVAALLPGLAQAAASDKGKDNDNDGDGDG